MSDPIHERFERLQERHDDDDWRDVVSRAALRPGRGRWALAAVAAVVALALPAIGLGVGGVLPFFKGKPAPERIVKFFAGLKRGYPHGMDPGVIANQTRQVLDVNVAEAGRAILWVAPAQNGGYCDLLELDDSSPGGCADHPLGFSPSVWFGDSMSSPAVIVTGATDLPDAAKVEIEFADGEYADAPFVWVSQPIGAAFFVYGIPREHWKKAHAPIALVLRDSNGKELARRPLRVGLPRRIRNAPAPPYRKANEQPLQHGAVDGAVLDVYRSGLVDVRFTSTDSGAYAFLAPKVHNADRHTVTIECAHLSYRDGRWRVWAGGTYADFRERLQAVVPTPTVPFDECSVRGHYGRRWDEHVGYHNAVEVPFKALAVRFFAEQAAARRLAYFVRSPKMHDIREALKAGGTAPSSEEIAARFDESVVALSSRGETPPPGRVGVWSDSSDTIVAAEQAGDGRRLWVELDRGRRGDNDLHGLTFVF